LWQRKHAAAKNDGTQLWRLLKAAGPVQILMFLHACDIFLNMSRVLAGAIEMNQVIGM
jgi:hypothetical protein